MEYRLFIWRNIMAKKKKPYSELRWRGTAEELKKGLKKRKKELTLEEKQENQKFLDGIKEIIKNNHNE